MKTLQNITDEIMGHIADKDQVDPKSKVWHWGEPVDILPLLRENIETIRDFMYEFIDNQGKVWNDEYPMKAIWWNITEDGKHFLGDCEADRIMFSWRFPTETTHGNTILPETKEIMEALMIIMLSDCTGCCNALNYITVSQAGILAYGDFSATYHS